MNGLALTVGITQPWNTTEPFSCFSNSSGGTDMYAFEAQVSYSWTGDFAGKVWVGAFGQEVQGLKALILLAQQTKMQVLLKWCFNIYL